MYMTPIFIIIEDRMKILLTALFLMLATTVQAKDFSLIDQNGVQHQMSWYARTPDAKIILVSYDGNSELREKVEELQAQSTQTYYFFVYPGNNRELESTTIPILMDDTKLVTQDLGFYAPGLAAALDSRNLEIESSYSIHGYTYEFPEFVREKATPDYTTEVAPIIAKNCAACHREGGIAPFAFNSSQMLVGWAPMVREVLLTKRMPPGQIDPYVGEFKNSMTLTIEETQTLVDWIDAGTPVN
jgi:mono/diheme cytochrome c family protein